VNESPTARIGRLAVEIDLPLLRMLDASAFEVQPLLNWPGVGIQPSLG